MTIPVETLREQVAALPWYHRMTLPGGVVTPGVADTRLALPRLHLPARLDGRSVLDIGAWDGFYSFEAKRRGAARVLATDSYSWSGQGWGRKDGFRLARQALGLDVEDLDVDVMDLSPEKVGGTFDVVLFLGVLYHVRDPITALERVASVTGDVLILETESTLSWLPTAAAQLYPTSELNRDDTNWWSINERALCGLLRRFGFTDVRRVYATSTARRVARGGRDRLRKAGSFRDGFRSRRVVLHARRG